MAAVFMVRIEPTAEASLAAMRERSKFGMAIAAMIKMIATTISNSINEKPLSRLIITLLLGAGLHEFELVTACGSTAICKQGVYQIGSSCLRLEHTGLYTMDSIRCATHLWGLRVP